MGQSFDHRFHHSFVLYAIVVPRNDHGGRPAHGEWMLTTETSLHGRRSMVKAPSLAVPQLSSCASSGQWLRAPRLPGREAGPPGAQPPA